MISNYIKPNRYKGIHVDLSKDYLNKLKPQPYIILPRATLTPKRPYKPIKIDYLSSRPHPYFSPSHSYA